LVERAVEEFESFEGRLKYLPTEVTEAEHLVALKSARRGFSPLYWHLSNSPAGTNGFDEAVIYMDRMCSWCFDTLSRADGVLERYFSQIATSV
jgi:hypothetical protein